MPLLLLRQLLSKNGLIGLMAAALIAALMAWHHENVELKKIQAVYENPHVSVIYRQGPVRIVTRTIKETTGREITETTEDRAPVERVIDKQPVPIAVAMAPARTDRYLLTLGMNRLTMGPDGKALFVGYGFKNRVDIQVGGVEHDGFSPWVLATLRF